MSVLGAIVIARNGDRGEYYQDPKTYAPSLTDSTALGVSDLHLLGSQLRAAYLTPGSASFISSISGDLADTQQVKVRAKAGGEGSVVFDSAVALLQGLFPPSSRNKITLANETVVTAPLGGYQYIPMETVEPGNDRSLESWTDCPAFQKHIASFHGSDEFKAKAKEATGFFQDVKDYIFGRPANLENIIYDFISTQLTYNQTYAYRLPPSYIDQARALADFHEDGVFSDEEPNGVGNIAGRTLLHTILTSLERMASKDDPLQLMLVQTSYQPFISLFHQTEMVKENPELKGIPNFGSALTIELRSGSPPDLRDFLRFKFKNGTADPQDWRLLHPFGQHADIPLTEFIYRAEGAAITSNKEWAKVCGTTPSFSATARQAAGKTSVQLALGSMLFFALFVIIAVLRSKRVRAGYVRLPEDDVEVSVRATTPRTNVFISWHSRPSRSARSREWRRVACFERHDKYSSNRSRRAPRVSSYISWSAFHTHFNASRYTDSCNGISYLYIFSHVRHDGLCGSVCTLKPDTTSLVQFTTFHLHSIPKLRVS
ncbi:histidine phosphatase superfamily [Mycena metata]|uniref:Histidine phosphatase superfamily n=1 Tax=Mycena metata TaxID=1033252 RepID=A0AAD7K1K1_9AGAR|nr:histidine phosphatase superfamily [Mycena metata]